MSCSFFIFFWHLLSNFFKIRFKVKIWPLLICKGQPVTLWCHQVLFLVLHWAKIWFSGLDDFIHIAHHPYAIRAISAMKLGDPVEVLEFLAIENNKVFTWKLLDTVNRKASQLIERHTEVQQHDWKNHAVDDGACDEIDSAWSFDQSDEANLMVRFHKLACRWWDVNLLLCHST